MHSGSINVETLRMKNTAPFSIIGLRTCTHPNQSFSYSTVPLHEICSKCFLWLTTITLEYTHSHVIFSQKRCHCVFTNNYFITTNEILWIERTLLHSQLTFTFRPLPHAALSLSKSNLYSSRYLVDFLCFA